MSVQNKTQFDFRVYDAIMKNAGAGLKIILAAQLLRDVSETASHFQHPLAKDLATKVVEVDALRAMWKVLAQVEQRKAA